MKYQITAPLTNYLKDLQTISEKSLLPIFPCVFLSSIDETLLEAGVDELVERIRSEGFFHYDDFLVHSLVDAKNFKQSFLQLISTLHCNAGFNNEYKGILTVDLSEFINDEYADELVALLAYLADYEKDRVYVFYSTGNSTANIETQINRFFACKSYKLRLDKPIQKVNYSKTLLERKHLFVAEDAEQSFASLFSSSDIRTAEIHQICRDLSYEALLLEENAETVNLSIIENYAKTHRKIAIGKTTIGLIK